MTEHRTITRPETGRREDLDRTPHGLVVAGRTGTLGHPRDGARRVDRRDPLAVDDRERVLVVLANLHDAAAHLATAIVEALQDDRVAIEVAALAAHAVPRLADYDAVVIGSLTHLGRHGQPILDYIGAQRAALATMPAFFYAVDRHGDPAARARSIDRVRRRTGWVPTSTATFTGADDLPHDEVRTFARRIADEIPTRTPLQTA